MNRLSLAALLLVGLTGAALHAQAQSAGALPTDALPTVSTSALGPAFEAEHAVVMFSMTGCYACAEMHPHIERLAGIGAAQQVSTDYLYFAHVIDPPYEWVPQTSSGPLMSGPIEAFPTIVMFDNGREVAREVGYTPEGMRRIADYVRHTVETR